MADVKPLKWRPSGRDKWWGLVSYAKTAHGYYTIAGKGMEGYYVGLCREIWEDYVQPAHFCKTIDKAKAWAERQHEKEVRKWLT